MDAAEQRSFIRFPAEELKRHSREVMVYQLSVHLLRQAGFDGVEEILDQAHKSPQLQERLDENFRELDRLLPPADPSHEDRVRELLTTWKPRLGRPN